MSYHVRLLIGCHFHCFVFPSSISSLCKTGIIVIVFHLDWWILDDRFDADSGQWFDFLLTSWKPHESFFFSSQKWIDEARPVAYRKTPHPPYFLRRNIADVRGLLFLLSLNRSRSKLVTVFFNKIVRKLVVASSFRPITPQFGNIVHLGWCIIGHSGRMKATSRCFRNDQKPINFG